MFWVKLINFIFSTLIAVKIRKLSKYILNFLFFVAFISWGLFILTDGILFIIAPNGKELYYTANIIRDLDVFFITVTPLCLLLASFVIKEGEEIAFVKKKKRLMSLYIVNFIIIVLLIVMDRVLVLEDGAILSPEQLPPSSSNFSVNFDSLWLILGINKDTIEGFLAFIFYLSLCGWYFFAVFQLFYKQKYESSIKRLRAKFIALGIIMIPMGIIYFIIIPFLKVPSDFKWLTNTIGQVIWASSPLFVFLGMRLK
ncbi:MAG: hypothetical protein ACTSYS_10580 [Promethearchaeota archaeon]